MSIIENIIRNNDLIVTIDNWFDNNYPSFFIGENNEQMFNNPRMLRCGGIINLGQYSRIQVVKWRGNGITFYEATGDTISFEFLGCVMAKICIDGKYYVAHIHCASMDRPKDDTRAIWSNFIYTNRDRISELIMFRPGHQYNRPYKNYPSPGKISTWGIITSSGDCYTIVVKYDDNDKASLESIYKHDIYGTDVSSYDFILNSDYSLFNIVSIKWDVFWQFRRIQQIFPAQSR